MALVSIGVDIGGTFTKLLKKVGSNIVAKETIKTKTNNGLLAVLEAISSFCGANGINTRKRRNTDEFVIGISSPGIWDMVDGEQTVIGNCFNLPWLLNCHLISDIQNQFGIKAHGLNDAKLQIYGQCAFGAARGAKVVVGLTLGTGIGGAVVINDKIFLGADGYAGELGHISICQSHYARKCNCGNIGCLEAYAGTAGFLRTVKECVYILGAGQLEKSDMTDIKKIFSLAKKHPEINPACLSAVKETSKYLAQGLSGLLLAFNPRVVVFDGQISRDMGFFWPFIEAELQKILSQKQVLEKLKIVPSSDPEYSGAIGAAAYAEARHRGEEVIMSW
jgi:glucokinase